MTKLDDTDREILSILRQDARMPVATLAHKLRVSRGTVQNRLRKMEEGGVIVGYTVRLRPDSEPQRIRAWMCIAVEGAIAIMGVGSSEKAATIIVFGFPDSL